MWVWWVVGGVVVGGGGGGGAHIYTSSLRRKISNTNTKSSNEIILQDQVNKFSEKLNNLEKATHQEYILSKTEIRTML